jgi:competence ComEA-like helix-hairpin-helix protein
MIELSKDERRLAFFLSALLIAGALFNILMSAFPDLAVRLGFEGRKNDILTSLTPADSAKLAGLIERARTGEEEAPPEFPLDINRASSHELQYLPGIGEAKAGKIIEMRESMGSFAKVDDLLEVKGIGPKMLEKIRPYVVVKEDTADIK